MSQLNELNIIIPMGRKLPELETKAAQLRHGNDMIWDAEILDDDTGGGSLIF